MCLITVQVSCAGSGTRMDACAPCMNRRLSEEPQLALIPVVASAFPVCSVLPCQLAHEPVALCRDVPVSDAPAAGRLQDRVYTVIDSAVHLLRHCLHSHIESSALFSSRLQARSQGGFGGFERTPPPPPPPQGPIMWKYGKGPGHSIRRLGDSWAARPIQCWSFPHLIIWS